MIIKHESVANLEVHILFLCPDYRFFIFLF